jgi:hypothetical protein
MLLTPCPPLPSGERGIQEHHLVPPPRGAGRGQGEGCTTLTAERLRVMN